MEDGEKNMQNVIKRIYHTERGTIKCQEKKEQMLWINKLVISTSLKGGMTRLILCKPLDSQET